jgi:hypothetical protein
MEVRLPIPKNWQDFEMLCFQLWKDIWADPNAQRNGRQGQPQHGVDIWGMPAYRSKYAGVQCKDKDSRLGKELSPDELESECAKAQDFAPTIRLLMIIFRTASEERTRIDEARVVCV